MVPDLGEHGHLPPGRYRCDLDAVRSRFRDHDEFAHSSTRRGIWSEWEQATKALRRIVRVSAVWLGGSYISSRPDPGDLDSVYLVPALDVNAARQDPRSQQTMAIFADNLVNNRTGLRLDTFVLPWLANPRLSPNNSADWPYLIPRGYWDDWWQRCRIGPKNAPPPPESAIPRRGYVEMILDGFTV